MGKKWLVWAALLCVLLLIAVVIVAQLAARSRDVGGDREERLLVPEGWRAAQVYDAGDRALGLARGTTEAAAAAGKLNLPAAAKGNPEGYLFPATYPIDADTSPQLLLSFMVNTARSAFAADGLPAAAKQVGLTTHQAATVASIVQAEADNPADMGRVARVVHNRLARNMPLQMDSTINYALDRSTVDTSHTDTRTHSPYNTYRVRGLPPTPIGNPGREALRASVEPPAGDWLYFVTVRPGDTRFTADYAEHRRNVAEFNEERRRSRSAGPAE